MNTQQLRTQLREILSSHAYDIGDLSDRIDELFAEFESQPLAVVVPAIEWGEWKPERGVMLRHSTCGGYYIHRSKSGLLHYPFSYFKSERLGEGLSELDAISACQAHKQAQITKALEGCNVVVQRDAQGLVDAMSYILGIDEARAIEEPDYKIYSDDTFRGLATDEIRSAIKAWEAGK